MREIKCLGNMKQKNDKRNYIYSEFECPVCGSIVLRKRKDGIKQNFCSHECYALNRNPRGAYKEFIYINDYKYIYKPEHPHCTKLGYVAEHRLKAEEKIGRLLENDEVVHHIDFNKTNNSFDNLMVMTASEHSQLHQSLKERNHDGKFKI